MTMLSDDVLKSLFTETAVTFEVPDNGARDIMASAESGTGPSGPSDEGEGTDELGAPRRRRDALARHRVLAIAACMIVVIALGGVGLIVTQSPGPSSHPTSVASGPTSVGGTASPGNSGRSPSSSKAAAPTPAFASAGAASGSTVQGTAQPGTADRHLSASADVPAATSAGRDIIQTGALDLVVRKGALSSTLTSLTALATRADGTVAKSDANAEAGASTPNASITLEVPQADFPSVLKEAQALGHNTKLTTRATDVTGNYVDLGSRITSLEASRQQYLTIMAKATSISDILAVQAQLDTLESQIEQLQGQLSLLTNQTTYATLTVTVHEPARPGAARQSARGGIRGAFDASVHGFGDAVNGLIVAAGPILFAVLLGGVLFVAVKFGWRRWQRHNL